MKIRSQEETAMDHDHEFLSECCGASESSAFAGFCSQCKDHTVFTCECGAERLSRHD